MEVLLCSLFLWSTGWFIQCASALFRALLSYKYLTVWQSADLVSFQIHFRNDVSITVFRTVYFLFFFHWLDNQLAISSMPSNTVVVWLSSTPKPDRIKLKTVSPFALVDRTLKLVKSTESISLEHGVSLKFSVFMHLNTSVSKISSLLILCLFEPHDYFL